MASGPAVRVIPPSYDSPLQRWVHRNLRDFFFVVTGIGLGGYWFAPQRVMEVNTLMMIAFAVLAVLRTWAGRDRNDPSPGQDRVTAR